MSLLEKLPTEILERVFLFCLNFDMPRASPVLCGKLSSQHVYVEAVMAALDPTWEESYARIKGGAPADCEMDESIAGCPYIQSALFRCRWASLQILQRAESAWLRRAASVKRSVVIGQQLIDPPDSVISDQWEGSADDALQHRSSIWRWIDKDKDDLFEADYEYMCNVATGLQCAEMESLPWIPAPPQPPRGLLSIRSATEIPESLLKGPWTTEMVKHLFWFARAGAQVDWLDSTSGEVATAGLHTAIDQGNLPVLFLFHCLGIQEGLSIPLLRSAMNSGDGDRLTVMTRLMYMLVNTRLNAEWGIELMKMQDEAGRRGRSSDFIEAVHYRWSTMIQLNS
ncbi:MAG: magnesium ion transporter [Claussenomyces sp. TS43310]|nr:MAG: magnesium ion transporter [Claussenomyces sp. TS43310]